MAYKSEAQIRRELGATASMTETERQDFTKNWRGSLESGRIYTYCKIEKELVHNIGQLVDDIDNGTYGQDLGRHETF